MANPETSKSPATRSVAARGRGETRKVCLLTTGGQELVLDIRYIREVFVIDSVTPVPGAPPALRGVIQLRGTVMPLVDLRPVLDLSMTGALPKFAVVLHHEGQHIAVLVEKEPEILTVHNDDFLDAPGHGSGAMGSLAPTLLKVGERFFSVPDVSRILPSVETS